jgi:hypothetical protein
LNNQLQKAERDFGFEIEESYYLIFKSKSVTFYRI